MSNPDCCSRKHPYYPHRRDWNFQEMEGCGGGWVSVRPKKIEKCMKLNWNFQRSGGGMDNFWNYMYTS